MDAIHTSTQLTTAEKKDLLKDVLGNNIDISGNNFTVFSKVIDYVGKVDDVLTLSEFIPLVAPLVNSPFMRVTASGSSFLSVFLFPFSSLIKLINANQTGEMLYSYRAISYTITAWTFDKPIPDKSSRILSYGSKLHPKSNQLKEERKSYDRVWKKSSDSTLKELSKYAKQKGVNDRTVKILLRCLSDNSPRKLSKMVLKGFEDKIPATAKIYHMGNYDVLYPH